MNFDRDSDRCFEEQTTTEPTTTTTSAQAGSTYDKEKWTNIYIEDDNLDININVSEDAKIEIHNQDGPMQMLSEPGADFSEVEQSITEEMENPLGATTKKSGKHLNPAFSTSRKRD